jgi:hypothetical protein
MTKRTCTIDGCVKAHAAKGYCKAHYNKLVDVDRHKTTIVCAECGTTHVTTRQGSQFCSVECHTWNRFGYCKLPADHWARWYGMTSKWTPPAFKPEPRDCAWCGDEFIATQPTRIMCGKACKWKAKAARRRAYKLDVGGMYSKAQVNELARINDYRCAYCDEACTNPDPDHVVPLARGGSNSITNIVPSCKPCNSDKRDLLLHEWYADRGRRGLEPRRLSDTFTHLSESLDLAA